MFARTHDPTRSGRSLSVNTGRTDLIQRTVSGSASSENRKPSFMRETPRGKTEPLPRVPIRVRRSRISYRRSGSRANRFQDRRRESDCASRTIRMCPSVQRNGRGFAGGMANVGSSDCAAQGRSMARRGTTPSRPEVCHRTPRRASALDGDEQRSLRRAFRQRESWRDQDAVDRFLKWKRVPASGTEDEETVANQTGADADDD